ncbi:MAG: Signal transduction histidine kinase CheA [Nitrospira sp.]|nr:MAG: Signal transduction histidine kinase CheA [Nitrospira sp.]
MNLDAAVQTFLAESRELLDGMEELLLQLESNPGSECDINAIFRAAHTIKGSAGLFGFDDIVRFTHKVENLLDRLRDKPIGLDVDCIALLLMSCDYIRVLVDAVSTNQPLGAEAQSTWSELARRLDVHLGVTSPAQVAPAAVSSSGPVPAVSKESLVELNTADYAWHVSVRFGRDVLRGGMDPLSFIRYLGTVGNILHLTTIMDALPSAEDMDPESCYLGFEIRLCTQADKAAIENVFEFVRDDCTLRILPPRSKYSEYIQLINELPEDTTRLGEILVKSGALTQAELDRSLGSEGNTPLSDAAGDAARTEPKHLGDILVREGMVAPSLVHAAQDKQRQVREQKSQESRFIRVEADRLDQLINLVGELVIAGAGTQLLAKRAGVGDVLESASTICRLLEEVRNNALGLRMVQIGATFQRFQRVVRDISHELDKDVELVISGGETELDKSVVERIGDPLMHLVRNAMDHGIESREMRSQGGKSGKAKLTLNAYHDSGSIVIEVSDDGGGLNRERILKKARERGLVGETQVLSERDTYNLIFEPGFSTAQQISNLSGRGVGMDVVKRSIESLRGTVELMTKERLGTTVQIRLPLTLAIIDGFLVGVGRNRYVIPLDMVLECVEMPETERKAAGREGHVTLRGKVLPFLRLRHVFDLGGDAGQRENIVVVQYGGQKIGLVVDSLLGEFQTVIKPLGTLFSQLRGFGGFTILGTGEVALILDVPALITAKTQGTRGGEGEGRRPDESTQDMAVAA